MERINQNIVRITMPYKDIFTTVYLIQTKEGILMFDAGSYPDDMDRFVIPALNELGFSTTDVIGIFISHNHLDHAGGLSRAEELFSNMKVYAGSDRCKEKLKSGEVIVLSDGDIFLSGLCAVSIPGHTPDAMGILDMSENILISGDALQVHGIFGSGFWGCNVSYPLLHLEALERLKNLKISTVLSAHDYSPFGYRADGEDNVYDFIDECAQGLYYVRDFILSHPGLDDEAAAESYNEKSGRPRVSPRIFKAVRAQLL